MQILKPTVEVWFPLEGEVTHIARCARVCYASEKGDDNKLIQSLLARKHYSMFRHSGVYYIIPKNIEIALPSNATIYADFINLEDCMLIATNRQFALENMQKYTEYEISYNDAIKDKRFLENGLIRITFCVTTGIDITRELNRKSPNAIAEQSTRYVDFTKKIGIIFKHCHWMNGLNLYKYCLMRFMAWLDQCMYRVSRSKYGLNLKPEDARWCLFLDTMSKAVYTYSVRQWEYILNMRLFDYTGKAHPDTKIVAALIKLELDKLGFHIRNYKELEEKTISEATTKNVTKEEIK